jgi:hypothetical protein
MVLLALCALAVAGCESSQAKSARLAKAARTRPQEKGVEVTTQNPGVKIVATTLVHDQYGSAVVVELRAKTGKPQADLPLAFAVTEGGKQVFANDSPGLADTLTHVPLLLPKEHVWWVHDQVSAPKGDVKAKVGTSTTKLPAKLPRMVTSGLKIEQDPDGTITAGKLRNDSGVAQLGLVIYAVAEQGGRIVAAGRAGIDRLKAHGTKPFKVFWIGNPKGATVHVFAPPTVLEEAQ